MRILVVEDYKPLRKSLTKGLQEAGFAVDATGDGEEGLWYARSNEYDAIVLDLMLPGIGGLTILEKLRNRGVPSHILILTAKDTVEDRVRGLDLGADDYLVKPFAFEELLARLRALVRRKYTAKSPIIRIADLEIDTASRTARRGGEEIDLTARDASTAHCGLGLSIVEKVVAVFGGAFEARSDAGGEFSINVSIPAGIEAA
jgi:DNA-binding response OmpR family regulator